jgi:hypothetical protein
MSEVGQLVAEPIPGERAPASGDHAAPRKITPYEWLALLAAVVPIVVAASRTLVSPWRPTYDAGYYSARALDVFTSHHPLVGAWSTLSFLSGDGFNNLGSLQLLLLAPFVRLDPFWGAALGVGVVNALSVVATWFAARRLFGPSGVVVVMGATLVLEACFGQQAWIDARPQLALLLPFWAFLWLTAAMMRGFDAVVLPWVLAGSLALQTHFSYSYLVLALVVLGAAGYIWANRTRWRARPFRVGVAGGLVWALLLWSHPIWDQLFRDQNLSAVIRHADGERPAGLLAGWRIAGDSPLGFPFWWPGSVSRFDPPWSGSTWRGGLVLGAWLAALLVLLVIAVRRRHQLLRVLLALSVVLTLVAWVTASRITGGLPQNYFWIWPVSLFAAVCLIAGVARLVPPVNGRATAVAAALVVAVLFAVPSGLTFDAWALAPELEDSGGRSSLDRLSQRVGAIRDGLDGAVVVEPVADRLLVPDYYNVIAVLRAHGIDVHFAPGSDDLHRFGFARCETGSERFRLHVVVGPPPARLPAGSSILLETPGLSARAVDEARMLDREMEALFDRGAFAVDRSRLDELGGSGHELRRMLDQPGESHGMLFRYLGTAVDSGVASVPEGYDHAFVRWRALYSALYTAKYSVFVTPNAGSPLTDCDQP